MKDKETVRMIVEQNKNISESSLIFVSEQVGVENPDECIKSLISDGVPYHTEGGNIALANKKEKRDKNERNAT